ncbi:MAG TPA: hypothetical protein VN892_18360 [Solirubrobacteraceae bacterium]|nr:hypothetical protein [Solirubrobacteraceae bacterium]
MNQRELLEDASFGQRVAEDEIRELSEYFVETSQWKRLYAGERDIVLGPKGAGKSALYSLVLQKAEELLSRNILVVPAENPEGTPVFQSVAADPPTSEHEFEGLWKLYFLSLIADVLGDWGVDSPSAREVYGALEDAHVLERKASLSRRLQAVREYVKRFFEAKSVEATLNLDPGTGAVTGMTGKITLGEPSVAQAKEGFISLDELLDKADRAMDELNFEVWIVLDRLDVAFARDENLERNALRALFAAYLDMKKLQRVSLKIFLRSDIWDRVTEGKFAEASHINEEVIEWEAQGLRQLMLRRILRNQGIAEFYDVDPESVFASVEKQQALVARLFPDQIDAGKNPKTFDWMLTRTQDGVGKPAPRELIHLLASLRDRQIRRLELGHDPPPGENLFERTIFKEALKDVSEVRLKKTLYAEYPDLKPYIEALREQKAQQSLPTLSALWDVPEAEARQIATRLVAVGFFERRGDKANPDYWVPFLYRDSLELVMGEAKVR